MATLKIKFDLILLLRRLKTHKFEFCFSGLPKFDNQGCHISGGYEDTISRLMSDDGQNTNLNYPAFRFFRGIRLESCILRPPVSYLAITVNGSHKFALLDAYHLISRRSGTSLSGSHVRGWAKLRPVGMRLRLREVVSADNGVFFFETSRTSRIIGKYLSS